MASTCSLSDRKSLKATAGTELEAFLVFGSHIVLRGYSTCIEKVAIDFVFMFRFWRQDPNINFLMFRLEQSKTN